MNKLPVHISAGNTKMGAIPSFFAFRCVLFPFRLQNLLLRRLLCPQTGTPPPQRP